jgi:hypothetical protein
LDARFNLFQIGALQLFTMSGGLELYTTVSPGAEYPSSIHRAYEGNKPKFQLRSGEEGLSTFNADIVIPEDVLPHFRPGTLLTTQLVELIESFGLKVVKTPGDPMLPPLLRDNHWEIRPGSSMVESPGCASVRNQFKAALKKLEKAIEEGSK